MSSGRPQRLSLSAALAIVIVAGIATNGFASEHETGILTGVIRDAATGRPVPWADVTIDSLGLGTIAQGNGAFTLHGVTEGSWAVTISRIGYAGVSLHSVTINAGAVTAIQVAMTVDEHQIETIDVSREHFRINDSYSFHTIDQKTFRDSPVNSITDALIKQPGVVLDGNGQLHVRGGRSDEVKIEVDGIPVTSAFESNVSLDVSFAALDELELLSGGYDAEYGNAQSGIVRIKTAEGGRKFSGLVQYHTDDYGADDKTYFNSDDVIFALGGPLHGEGLRFHLSGQAEFSDTYLPMNVPSHKHEFLGITFADRRDNRYRGQAKLTHHFTSEKKISVSGLFHRRKFTPYRHQYSRVGWWSEESDHWWYEPLDDTYEYYSAPEHSTWRERVEWQASAHWTHTLSPAMYYTFKLARFESRALERIGQLEPSEYEPLGRDEGQIDPLNNYYIVAGDFPLYEEYESAQWTAKADVTHQWNPANRFKAGLEANYYDISNFRAESPDSNSPLGFYPDLYNVYAWGGAAYIQDRFIHEGMVLNAGVRWDFFDPGLVATRRARAASAGLFEMIDATGLGARIKSGISPRLGMAYPITDRDVLHFQYGRFQQLPSFNQIYRGVGGNRIAGGGLYGNIDLEPQKTISYELGVDHQLTRMLNLDLTLFYRDIFGWIDTDQIEEGNLGMVAEQAPYRYVNRAYGTSRGFEVLLRRRFHKKFQGDIAYTFSRSTGTHSTNDTGRMVGSGALNRPPLRERPLDWDRTHNLSAGIVLSDPGLWVIGLNLAYESGEAFTPKRFGERHTFADSINSRRLPSTSRLDVRANKLYSVYGQEFRLYVEGSNLLDNQNVRSLSPGSAAGNYVEAYTEDGELGGGFRLNDVNFHAEPVLIALNDPSVWDPPRQVKVGVMVDW